ncbi:hypothetical protein INR49_009226 [Caranx melampygus]|nr:hypothetical protein INR49_009226 [Caranx melampygus]
MGKDSWNIVSLFYPPPPLFSRRTKLPNGGMGGWRGLSSTLLWSLRVKPAQLWLKVEVLRDAVLVVEKPQCDSRRNRLRQLSAGRDAAATAVCEDSIQAGGINRAGAAVPTFLRTPTVSD